VAPKQTASKKKPKPAPAKAKGKAVKPGPRAAAPRPAGAHPNDPALSALLARLEQLYDFAERSLKGHRQVHPSDPALSTLLARLAAVEDRLDQIMAALAARPAAKAGPAALPKPVGPSGGISAPVDLDSAQFLARTPLFAKLTAAECSVLAQFLEAKALPAGAVLFSQGDFGDAMYVVKQGALEILKNDVFGDVRVAEVRPGSLVGEMALVEDKPRSANVRASEDCRLLVLSRSAYAELKKAHPQVATKFQDELLQLLSGRLRQTTEKLAGKN
jgi:CRP/FNR family cyclic AMP-dependent transcriptional regulator